jgi:hypothetical protein
MEDELKSQVRKIIDVWFSGENDEDSVIEAILTLIRKREKEERKKLLRTCRKARAWLESVRGMCALLTLFKNKEDLNLIKEWVNVLLSEVE